MPHYSDTLAWLYGLEVERMDLKLDRTTHALRLCREPHAQFPAIHIAGTNGKGSTAAMLHAVLSAAGYRVGLFTSPHLIDFCERIRLGRRYITEQEVVDGVAAIRACIAPSALRLTPFEMMTVLAFRAFAQTRVDLAVVEVGLGGRLDATNVLSPLVSVITSIGLDHQQYLGPTLSDIAREKGGIIKPGVPVVIGRLESESLSILRRAAQDRQSPTLIYGQDFTLQEDASGRSRYRGQPWRLDDLPVSLHGKFQRRNAAVACAALGCIQAVFPVTTAQISIGLQSVTWPGRLDIVSARPFVIVDGAHNMQAMETLMAELRLLAPDKRVIFLFGVMRDKDWRAMVPILGRIASQVVVTAVAQPRAEDPYTVHAAFSSHCPVRVVTGAQTACRQLLAEAGPHDVIVVCGSLFLAGEVLPLFSDPPLARAQQAAQDSSGTI